MNHYYLDLYITEVDASNIASILVKLRSEFPSLYWGRSGSRTVELLNVEQYEPEYDSLFVFDGCKSLYQSQTSEEGKDWCIDSCKKKLTATEYLQNSGSSDISIWIPKSEYIQLSY